MLERLEIENFILIDKVAIDFAPGFNVLTGETGAGKSMILKSLQFLSDGKGGTELLRRPDGQASVTAVFCLDDSMYGFSSLRTMFAESGMDVDSRELILRRVCRPNGRVSSFIQGGTVTSALLSSVAGCLLVHNSQRSENSLLKNNFALQYVDRYSGLDGHIEKAAELRRSVCGKKKRIDGIKQESDKARAELDYLQYAVDELRRADLHIGEDDDVRGRLKLMHLSAQLTGTLQRLSELIGHNVLENIAESRHLLSKIKDKDETLSSIEAGIDELSYSAEDISDSISRYNSTLSFAEEDEAILSDRLDLISKMKRKYGGTIEDALKFLKDAESRIESISNRDATVAEIRTEMEKELKELNELASAIYARRQSAAKEIDGKTIRILHSLALKDATFQTVFEHSGDPLKDDAAEFYVSLNKGRKPVLLRNVASGGEISRIFLALLSMEKQKGLETEIFDEIDAGLGGETANDVAKYLLEMSVSHQVIAITHLANVAAKADNQVSVGKESDGNSTCVHARSVNGEDRVAEIARMLSGIKSETAMAHAREMLTK